jgi:hypothetical protein
MSTTHKATPYAREYNYKNDTGFRSIDYPLSHGLQLQVAEVLGEALTGDHGPDAYLYDIVSEVVDSVMPVYYTDIMDEWREADCPDPEDSDHDPNSGPVIFGLMTRALREAIQDFAGGLVYLVDRDDEDIPSALAKLNTVFPYKTE